MAEVKYPFDKAIVGSQGSSGTDLEKSVDAKSPGRSWVWIPSMHDLATHYVRMLGHQMYLTRIANLISMSRVLTRIPKLVFM